MSDNLKEIDTKNCTYYFSDDEKNIYYILIYCTGYVTIRDLSYATTNSVKSLHLNINKINEYIQEGNGNKYLTLVPTDESKYTLKKYDELRKKMRYLIRLTSNNLMTAMMKNI